MSSDVLSEVNNRVADWADEKIKEVINNAGYDVVSIEREKK